MIAPPAGRRAAGLDAALTDLSYLVLAAFPLLGRFLSQFSRWRYHGLAGSYESRVVGQTAGYGVALGTALEQSALAPRWCGDIGAGTGAATRLLRARFPEARIVALDLSAPMLQARTPPLGVYRVVGNAWHLPFADNALDLIVIQNASPGFAEVTRVVRPGGEVLFSLDAAGRLPVSLRRRLLRRALPAGIHPAGETIAGSGITWSFRVLR